MRKMLRAFAYAWGGALCFFHVLGLIVKFNEAETWWQGWMAVEEVMSPFNVLGYVFLVIAASPAIGALVLEEKLRQRAARSIRQIG